MLFHEIYGSYFNVVAEVLSEACKNTLTNERLHEIIRRKAFDESVLEIPCALKEDWSLLTKDMKTPVKSAPTMPLTLLQKRWLKALLNDPRIKLFGVTDEGLEDIEPLYANNTFYYFDRYTDGDPFSDERYVAHFRTILHALSIKSFIEVRSVTRGGRIQKYICYPWHLEYSSKDDKFRLIATDNKNTLTININRITSVELTARPFEMPQIPKIRFGTLVMDIKDDRNALERAMLHFSHLRKETVRLDDNNYQMTIHYNKDDETELLIRVLSFGPNLRVISPDNFIVLIRERLIKQKNYLLT
jgi:hypothetical protein